MKRSPQLVATLSELEKHGAKVVSVTDTANSHAKVTFTYNGVEQFIIAGKNAASFDAPLAARRAVRHQLDIKRQKITGRRRVRRNTANRPAPTAPEHLTIKADPWKAIQGSAIAQQTAAFAADLAWARLMGLCLLNAGHVPTNQTIRHAIGVSA